LTWITAFELFKALEALTCLCTSAVVLECWVSFMFSVLVTA
jgi:hypothetical protein